MVLRVRSVNLDFDAPSDSYVLHQVSDYICTMNPRDRHFGLYNLALTEECYMFNLYLVAPDSVKILQQLRAKFRAATEGSFKAKRLYCFEENIHKLYSYPTDWLGIKFLCSKGSVQYREVAEKLFLCYRLCGVELLPDLHSILLATLLALLLKQQAELSEAEQASRALVIKDKACVNTVGVDESV